MELLRVPVRILGSALLFAGVVSAQAQVAPVAAPLDRSALNDSRILGVIPNYQTVSDPNFRTPPMRAKEKWMLAVKETIDPFNVVNAALGAGFSQAANQTPKYGDGAAAYGMRFGAALADFGTQNFFSAGVLACLLHQDPRYFRKGPEWGVMKRVGYSASRIFVARQDSGRSAFNASGIFGMALGIGASNLYYPSASIGSSVMIDRVYTSLTGALTGNLLSEFWPDVQRKLAHRRFLIWKNRT
jgi:hypothetical protein